MINLTNFMQFCGHWDPFYLSTKGAILNLKHVFPKCANFEATLYFDWLVILKLFCFAKKIKLSKKAKKNVYLYRFLKKIILLYDTIIWYTNEKITPNYFKQWPWNTALYGSWFVTFILESLIVKVSTKRAVHNAYLKYQ